MNSPPRHPNMRVLPDPKPVRAPGPAPQSGKDLPLSKVRGGQRVRLLSIHLSTSARDQLQEQGILETRIVRVLHNDHRGRVILRVGNELFILGRLETARIQVRVVE